MQPVLHHRQRDCRNLQNLMAQRIRVITPQQRAAAAAGIRRVLDHLIDSFDRQQLRPRSRMPWLAAALEATALATLRRHESRAIAGGWLGGVTGAAADPIPQLS